MAPSWRGGRRRIHCKKCLARRLKAEELQSTAESTLNPASLSTEEKNLSNGSSTPKARRFRIPERLRCPPAPKKRRVAALHCSSHKPYVSFFTSPDLELFFSFALHGTV